jgi:hypothetical protein
MRVIVRVFDSLQSLTEPETEDLGEMDAVSAKAFLDIVKDTGYGHGFVYSHAVLFQNSLEIIVVDEDDDEAN